MKIVVMGTGGMGGYIGGRLAQAGRDVTFVARGQHLQAIQQNGLQVRSPAGDFVIKPVKATDDPAQVEPIDLILFCVKSYDVLNAAEAMRPMVGPQTAIIPVQNGIEHIEQLGRLLGPEQVLGGVSLISAQITAPGIVQHNMAPNTLEFGEIDGSDSARCQAIQQTLTVDGFNAKFQPNIVERMWYKLAAYSGGGVFCVVRDNKSVIWETPETKELYRQAISEAVNVAQAGNIPLPDSVPEKIISDMDNIPPQWKPSLLIALEHGHRLELEAINGALSRIGKEAGVPTPINDFIYACLKPYIDGTPQPANDQ